MSKPTIYWETDVDFGNARRLTLWIPLEWYVNLKHPRLGMALVAWWLVKIAWRVLRIGSLFREIKE